MKTAALLSLMLLAAAPALADQKAPTPRQNPYSRLFQAREMLKQALDEKRVQPGTPKSRIVCGMTVIEVGPELDPKIAVTTPKDDKTRYTIRAVEPPICK